MSEMLVKCSKNVANFSKDFNGLAEFPTHLIITISLYVNFYSYRDTLLASGLQGKLKPKAVTTTAVLYGVYVEM